MDDSPIYLSEHALKGAVDRLGSSTAKTSLGDYLVFKRALVISQDIAASSGSASPTAVTTSTQSRAFVAAHKDVALWVQPDRVITAMKGGDLIECLQKLISSKRLEEASVYDHSLERPYFVPFGAKRDKSLGYRVAKWPSNGPSNTVNGWDSQSKSPLSLVKGTSPKEYEFRTLSKKDLESFFNIEGGAGIQSNGKPLLLDAAIWWFRSTNFHERFGGEPSEEDLLKAFTEDTGLDPNEVDALFQT